MPPVRIKCYGLFWMRKRAYLELCAFVVLIWLAIFLTLALTIPKIFPPPFAWPWEPVPPNYPPGLAGLWYHYFWSFIIGMLVLGAIEFTLVLRKFAAKEAKQRSNEEGQPGTYATGKDMHAEG